MLPYHVSSMLALAVMVPCSVTVMQFALLPGMNYACVNFDQGWAGPGIPVVLVPLTETRIATEAEVPVPVITKVRPRPDFNVG